MDIKQVRLENLLTLIKAVGSQIKFSRKVEIDSTHLSQIKNPKNKKNLGEKLARKIEGAMGLPYGWMDKLHHDPSKDITDQINSAETDISWMLNVEPGPDLPRKGVPVISWVQAGNAAEAIDNFEPGDAEEWVIPHHEPRDHTYALRISGESMAPRFPPGMILVIEPMMIADPGDFVIAKNGDEEATFKQLIKEDGKHYLKPLNPQFPVIEMGTFEVIGVVRDAIMKLK